MYICSNGSSFLLVLVHLKNNPEPQEPDSSAQRKLQLLIDLNPESCCLQLPVPLETKQLSKKKQITSTFFFVPLSSYKTLGNKRLPESQNQHQHAQEEPESLPKPTDEVISALTALIQ